MDLYTFMLFLGIAGLATMAFQGIGGGHGNGHGHGHGDGGGHGHAGHGHGGHGNGHAGHGNAGHANGGSAHAGHGDAAHGSHSHQSEQGGPSTHATHGIGTGISNMLWGFASPRTLFSISMGAGVAGPLMRPVMGTGVLLFIAALGLGVIFERVFVTPVWNLAFRFQSKPALMLDSCVEEEATAVTGFDRNGQGIVAIDLDGQVVQLLATLTSDDRALGAAVRAGDRVRIADVDSARNRCTVAVL